MSYCDFCKDLSPDNHHKIYHDHHYGFRINDDNEFFGRFILEINQAGLSWDIILKKQDSFREAYSNFQIDKIANYTDQDRERLLSNPGIIRNRLKINAAIHNANVILELQKKHGSFLNWIDSHHPLSKEEWVKIFKKHFKFTGGEIVNELLMSTGYLPGAHAETCEIYTKIKTSTN
jgi:DNA-3-methyladenine glycosylase I